MSYSIGVRAPTIAAALAALAVKFDTDVVAHQPPHAKDKDAALATAEAMTKLLGEQPAGMEVFLSLNGSLGWRGMVQGGDIHITSAGVGATAYYAAPPATPA